MARKFALYLKDGQEVRNNIEEITEYFDYGRIVEYFHDGSLLQWLEDRRYEKEAIALSYLETDAKDFKEKLCYIFHIDSKKIDTEAVAEDAETVRKKALITQRSLEVDVKDFKSGIKYALRQDPDVMLVGEIRDLDTLMSAIEAAETGHLVFATVHTNGTVASINRLKGFIEDSAQDQFMKRLSACIRGVIHQQLVPTTNDGNLTPAIEVLTFTSTVIDYVKEGKLYDITNLMKKSRQPNITTMNMALFSLYQKGMITKETAMEYSLERVEMEQMLRGMYRDNTALTESIL